MLVVLIATGVSLGSLTDITNKICVYINLGVHTHMYFYIWPSLYSAKHEFMLSATRIHDHIDLLNFSLYLPVNFHLNSEKYLAPTITMYLLNCSVPPCISSGFKIVNLYHHEKQLYRGQGLCAVPFAFSCAECVHFQS